MTRILLCVLFFVPYVGAIADDEFVFILRARGNPYWNSLRNGIEDTARANGIPSVVYQTESDKDSEEQLNLCQTVLARKPKFLAIAAVNAATGIRCLKLAAARGVAVADIDRQIPLEEAEEQGLHMSFSVGSDNLSIGREAAKYLRTLNPPQSTKVFILEGAPGAVAGKQRVQGFKEELRIQLPKAEIVASISGDWDRLKAMSVTSDLLLRTPDLDAIYAANDMMALGAVEAVRSAGRGGVRIIGVDGTEGARTAVAKGEISATVAQLPYYIGKRVVELGIRVVKGELVPRLESTETPVLTREKLADKNFQFHQYLR